MGKSRKMLTTRATIKISELFLSAGTSAEITFAAQSLYSKKSLFHTNIFVFTFVNYVSGYVCGYFSASSLVFFFKTEEHSAAMYICYFLGFFSVSRNSTSTSRNSYFRALLLYGAAMRTIACYHKVNYEMNSRNPYK